MTWNLSLYGHDAPVEDVKAAARKAFQDLAADAGAKGGSLSGTEGLVAFSISFPEPLSERLGFAIGSLPVAPADPEV